jgi:hypothetical protein
MDKNGVLTFKDWFKGMVKHPIYGFGLLQNVEVFENKGLAQIKNRSTLDNSITVTALPIAEAYDVYGNVYTLTGDTGSGAVYKNGAVIASGLGATYDMKIYKNYLWVRYQTVLSAYGPLDSGGAQWFANVDTGYNTVGSTTQSYDAPILIGQDDFLYIGNGNFVLKKEVTSSGTVGVAPVVATSATLDLPDGQFVSCLEEYGTKIAIGTHGGISGTDKNNQPNARLYTWNRQAGTLGNPGLADLPVIFSENGINAIKQHANKLYVSAGSQGNIYVTDGTNYQRVASIPYSPIGYAYSSTVYKNALAISPKGNLLVGLSGDLSPLSRAGIYEIDLNTEGNPISYSTPSTAVVGTVSTPTQYKIGFIKPKTYQITKIGWANGTTYGVDTSDFRLYASYGGIIETPLIRVGNFDTKKTFQEIEFSLASPLVSGQNIRISYRLNDKDSFTLIGTWGFSTIGSVLSFRDTAGITDAEYVQLKIELDQSAFTLYGSNINLIEVILR